MADPEEFRNRREHGGTGVQLHYWRADRRRGSHCADDWHYSGDRENNSGALLDKTSKGGEENRTMESMRDVDRVMEREIAKGSCPMKLDRIELAADFCQQIQSQEKFLDVLSYMLRIGDYKEYAGKTIINNVYMDFKGKKILFRRTKTGLERNRIFSAIRRHEGKKQPDYAGTVYLETARCFFTIPEESLVKYRYTYEGQETYAFPMSDKYILGLYTHCIVKRREMAAGDRAEGLSEPERGIVSLETVKDVLFQCLILDDVHMENGEMYMNLYTVYLLKNAGQEPD